MSKKVIVLAGNTGNGKSTTGNCLLNQSADADKILYGPFATDSGASGCTQFFNRQESDNFIVIDTVGFCDPNINLDKCLDNFRKAINSVNNKVDLFIYVFKQGRLTVDDVFFFETIRQELKNFPESNSVLVVTKCEKGWVECQENSYLSEAIKDCNGNYFEFDLRFDRDDDPPGLDKNNREHREQSIGELIKCVNELFIFKYESKKVGRFLRETKLRQSSARFSSTWDLFLLPIGTFSYRSSLLSKRRPRSLSAYPNATKIYKKILLVGITGSGKSTTGNCLINQSADEDMIKYGPFVTDSGANGCTQFFNKQKSKKSNLTVIDTVGFCDPNIKHTECLDNLRKAIKSADYKIDLIIYVFQCGRLTDDDVYFFKTAFNELKHLQKSNSLLVVTKCQKGWVREQNNSFLSMALMNCNGNYLEFELRHDNDDDPPGLDKHNREQRKRSIKELVNRVGELSANEKEQYEVAKLLYNLNLENKSRRIKRKQIYQNN
jgi:ribosome biogenesis GTPase A